MYVSDRLSPLSSKVVRPEAGEARLAEGRHGHRNARPEADVPQSTNLVRQGHRIASSSLRPAPLRRPVELDVRQARHRLLLTSAHTMAIARGHCAKAERIEIELRKRELDSCKGKRALSQSVQEAGRRSQSSFQIEYRNHVGSHGTLDGVRASDTAGVVLRRIVCKSDVSDAMAMKFRLIKEGKQLDLLASTASASLPLPHASPPFQVQFRALSGSHGVLDGVHAEDLAGCVLRRIAVKTGVEADVAGLRLLRAGKQLDLGAPCGLEMDETVHLAGRLDGGGSNAKTIHSAPFKRWEHALAGTRASLHAKLTLAADACASANDATADWRVWAFDVSSTTGAKNYIAAPTVVFVHAYLSLAPSERHAYECIELTRPCHPYFDLDAAIASTDDAQRAALLARRISDAAIAVLCERACKQPCHAEMLVLDATRPGKFSQHLVLHSACASGPLLLDGPAGAGGLAELVRERLHSAVDADGRAAAQLIDRSVYHHCRLFRLAGSTKLADVHSWPVVAVGAKALDSALLLKSLVAPSAPRASSQLLTLPSSAGKVTPAQEAAWLRLQEGETISQIANAQPSGKPIAPRTVINYILAAYSQGRPIDVQRFAAECATHHCERPSSTEVEQLRWAEAMAAVNVTEADVNQTALLKTFLPEAAKPANERTAMEKATLTAWHVKVVWFVALRRVGSVARLESASAVDSSAAKRARCNGEEGSMLPSARSLSTEDSNSVTLPSPRSPPPTVGVRLSIEERERVEYGSSETVGDLQVRLRLTYPRATLVLGSGFRALDDTRLVSDAAREDELWLKSGGDGGARDAAASKLDTTDAICSKCRAFGASSEGSANTRAAGDIACCQMLPSAPSTPINTISTVATFSSAAKALAARGADPFGPELFFPPLFSSRSSAHADLNLSLVQRSAGSRADSAAVIEIAPVSVVASAPRRAVLMPLRVLCSALSSARAAVECVMEALEYHPQRASRSLIYNSDIPIDMQPPRRRSRRGGHLIRCLHGLLSALASITAVASVMAVGALITSVVSATVAFSAGAIAAIAAASTAALGWALVAVMRSVADNAIRAHLRVFAVGPANSARIVTNGVAAHLRPYHQPWALLLPGHPPPPSPPPSPTAHGAVPDRRALFAEPGKRQAVPIGDAVVESEQGAAPRVASILGHPRLQRTCVKGDGFCSGAFCQRD